MVVIFVVMVEEGFVQDGLLTFDSCYSSSGGIDLV
jgi:hypothetical protein